MIDLTTNSKERETYIVGLKMLEEEKQYKVLYADGKESVLPFSIHNYQVDNRRMEKQYFTYATQFYDYFRKNKWVLFVRSLGYITLSFLGIFLELKTSNISLLLARGILLMQFILLSFVYSSKLIKLYLKKKKVDIMKAYMEKKESYNLTIFHPLTDELFNWSFMDLTEVDSFQNVQDLEEFRESITPEMQQNKVWEIQRLLLKNRKGDTNEV